MKDLLTRRIISKVTNFGPEDYYVISNIEADLRYLKAHETP